MSETNITYEHRNHAEVVASATRLVVREELRLVPESMPVATGDEPDTQTEAPAELVEETKIPERGVNQELLEQRREKRKARAVTAERPINGKVHYSKTQSSTWASSAKSRKRSRQEDEATDPVHVYLTQIGQFPLINKEKEVQLSQTIQKGRVAEAALASHVGRDRKQQRQQRQDVQAGLTARQNLIEANLRLVVSIAKQYYASSLPLLDLIQEGNLGLEHAVDKFDGEKGFKFSTYATWWVRQAITRGILNTSRTIRISVHAVEDEATLRKAREDIEEYTGQEASIEEVVEKTGFSRKKVLSAKEIDWRDPLSIDMPLNEESDALIGDVIPDEKVDVQEAAVTSISTLTLSDKIKEALEGLDEREREIIKRRFGLDGAERATLVELADYYNISRQAVHNAEARALAKLLDPSSPIMSLKAFLSD